MSDIGEQTYEAVADVVNDTFGDPMMDLPFTVDEPLWRRYLLPALPAVVVLVLLFFLWRRRRAAAAAKKPEAKK